jgi:hypothetical protein
MKPNHKYKKVAHKMLVKLPPGRRRRNQNTAFQLSNFFKTSNLQIFFEASTYAGNGSRSVVNFINILSAHF